MRLGNQLKLLDAAPADHFAEKNDEELLALLKSDDKQQRQQALSVIYRRDSLDVWRVIRGRVNHEPDAQDIFCDVWLTACRKLPDFVWQGKPIKHWLLATARRKCLAAGRAHRQEISWEQVDSLQARGRHALETKLLGYHSTASPPAPEVRAEADRQLVQILAILNSTERKIIELIYFKEKNSSEIGQLLDMKPAAVRKKHERLLKKLRAVLK